MAFANGHTYMTQTVCGCRDRTDDRLQARDRSNCCMARRSAPPPKPRIPILTVGQKRPRVERLQKCVTSLEAFDPQKARKRAPAILELEAAIDKALSSAFGHGTTAYLRYTEAATLDPSPLLTSVPVRAPAKAVGGPVRHDAKVQETRQHFLENKTRAITLSSASDPRPRRRDRPGRTNATGRESEANASHRSGCGA